MKIILDRHGPRLISNDCHLPYPAYFSLLSTFICVLDWKMDSSRLHEDTEINMRDEHYG
jgi:hypothetical protein